MITIYAFGEVIAPVVGLTRDLRALWAAEEAGLPYRVQPLSFPRGDLRAPDYLAVNPFGLIPAIEDEGFRLFESVAIVFYLADKAGKLLPAQARDRAQALQWALAAVNTLEPKLGELFVLDVFTPDAPGAKERRPALVETAAKRLAALDAHLAEREFLLGSDFSAPDILMSTVLRLAEPTGLLAGAPNVAAYKARCEARPAWTKIHAAYRQRVAA